MSGCTQSYAQFTLYPQSHVTRTQRDSATQVSYYNKRHQVEIIPDMENYWNGKLSDNGRIQN
jgi:hypothetical protein